MLVGSIFEAARGNFSRNGQFEMVKVNFDGARGFPCAALCFHQWGGVADSILGVFRRCGHVSEIDWIHSPSQLSTAHTRFEDRFCDGNEDILWDDWNLDKNNKPRASVVSNMLLASTSD